MAASSRVRSAMAAGETREISISAEADDEVVDWGLGVGGQDQFGVVSGDRLNLGWKGARYRIARSLVGRRECG